MKRWICLLLALSLLLSGCGGKGEEAPQTEASVQITTEPVTEPTLSPEEQLYTSLPERLRQAVDLGIVALSQLEDPERIVTIGEASAMLQKAYIHRTGAQSKVLNELMQTESYASVDADRGWILGIPGQVDMELTHGDQYENYRQWLKYLNDGTAGDLWWSFDERLGMLEVGVSDDETFYITTFFHDKIEPDREQYLQRMADGSVYGPEKPESYMDVYNYARKVFDSTTGNRFFTLEDGCIYPEKKLTVADAAEYALRFWNYPNPMEVPNFVAPENVGKYNQQIITSDLLEKQTDLPAASCTQLPAQWHGVVMDDMVYTEFIGHLDNRVYEYEIRAVKEAGFNFIGFDLDFGWLQDSLLITPGRDAYKGFVKNEDVGKLDLNRLEQLDQVLALCMKYDIHLNLRCVGVGGVATPGNYSNQYRELYNVKKYAAPLAEQWQAIARRYADIPNEYLSFTLFTLPRLEYDKTQVKNELLIPSVEAIRAVSPDRCIIADVFNSYQNAKEFAQMGVALSYRMTEPGNLFAFADSGYYTYNRHKFAKELNPRGSSAIINFDWPNQGGTDAAAMLKLAHPGGDSFQNVLEVAQEAGVGFMLSQFGVEYSPGYGDMIFIPRVCYDSEAYHTMIRDITSAVEAAGCGWCFAHWYSPYGAAFCLPVMEEVEYAQVEDHPYYIDQGLLRLFQSINDAA